MSNQLPVQPTPPSLLSIGNESGKARPRDIADDSFRDELTDVITSVVAPSENHPARDPEPTSESKPKENADKRISESKNEGPAKEEQPKESSSTDTESNEVEVSSSAGEESDESTDTNETIDLSEVVVEEILPSDEVNLVEANASAEEIAEANVEVEEISIANQTDTDQLVTREETTTQLGETNEEDTSLLDVDPLLTEESVTLNEEQASVENDSNDAGTNEEALTEEFTTDNNAEEISVTQETSAVQQNTGKSSENRDSKPNQKALEKVGSNAVSTDSTEVDPSTEEAINKPIQATSTQNFASELGTEIDGSVDVEAIDDGVLNETNTQNNASERQAEKLIESRSVRQTDTGAPRVDPSRFVSRVTKAFESAQQKGGPIEIRLSPPELGSLQVRLEVKEGILTASMETENQAARNAILDNLPSLRERLAEQQIRIEKFDVDVRDDSNPSDNWQQSEQQGDREAQAESDRHTPLPDGNQESDTNEAAPTASTIQLPNNGINLVA